MIESYAPHLRPWLQKGLIEALPATFSTRFEMHLNAMTWSSSGLTLELSSFAHLAIDLSKEPILIDEIQGTELSADELLVFLFSPSKPCLVSDLKFGLEHFDEIFWSHAGVCYMCGANRTRQGVICEFEHLAIYDGADRFVVQR